MSFHVLSADDTRWPSLVSAAGSDVFYEPSYCRFTAEGESQKPLLLLYEDDLGTVFDVTIAKRVDALPFFAEIAHEFPTCPVDLASPDYNSPIVVADALDAAELLRRYRAAVDQYCAENSVVTEFVRFHPLSESAEFCSRFLDVKPGAELLYVDLRAGYQQAHQAYRKGHKSTIKKAAREGASFRMVPHSDEALTRLFTLYTDTMNRKQAKSVYFHDYHHFAAMLQNLGDRVLMVESLFQEHVASANIFLRGRKHVWFKYSGLDQRYRNSGAHTYMMDRVIQWAAENGFEHFMLGGGLEIGDSTYCFKHGFSRASSPVHHGRKVHNPAILRKLVDTKQAYDARHGLVSGTEYFPSYWLTAIPQFAPEKVA